MFRKRKQANDTDIPVPAQLPEIEGMDEQADDAQGLRPRIWLWTLIAALVVVLVVVYVLVLGGKGSYDGLRDQALENQQFAQEHYERGLAQLEDRPYELAIAEFELALRHDSSLVDARNRLQEAKDMVQAQGTPTSETRQDAAKLLYLQAATLYEDGNLPQSVSVLDELRGLDADYQRENVETMLSRAHYQLGQNAVAENRLDDAISHFEAVLAIKPGDKDAQDQLNLADLYAAALNYWERDWSATIQALKGLYPLAPDYKDVKVRLRDAYVFRGDDLAEDGSWCQAGDDYASAAEILPWRRLWINATMPGSIVRPPPRRRRPRPPRERQPLRSPEQLTLRRRRLRPHLSQLRPPWRWARGGSPLPAMMPSASDTMSISSIWHREMAGC